MPGLPDHFNGVQLFGVFNNTLTAVAVDSDGNLYALLQGYDGAVYVPLRVDADGRIEAVLKGEYAGALDTVAVDDQGRLLVIPTDPENVWGLAVSVGNAEMAARLGALMSFDTRGNIIWGTAFGEGFGPFTFLSSGTGADYSIGVDVTDVGGYGLHLIGGSSASQNARTTRRTGFPFTGNIGFEASWTEIGNVDYVVLEIQYYDGTNAHWATVKMDKTNEILSVLDENNVHQTIASNVKYAPGGTFFNHIKLVADFNTDKYERLILNTTEYDVSAYNLYTELDVSPPHFENTVWVYSTAGNNGEIVLGRWIETRNEPANS